MKSRKIYDEYADKLYQIMNAKHVTENDVSNLFSKLLSILPNKGKLYKYKALETFRIDELEEKYVWFSSAKYLNDYKDCSFNANMIKEAEEIVKFALKDDNLKKGIIRSFHINLVRYNPDITLEMIEDCVKCISNNMGNIARLKFNSFCKKYKFTKEMRKELKNTVIAYRESEKGEDYIKRSMVELSRKTEEIRNNIFVLSLTTSYKKDSMWAYYCANKGICIEYDFSKIVSTDLKGEFVNTQKIRYGKKKKFRYVDIIKAEIEHSPDSLVCADKLVMEQILTKDKSWSTEEEWRVIKTKNDNTTGKRIYVDMISAIYLDYSILNEERTQRIIQLAKENGWGVYVRYFSQLEAEYRYDTLERTQELIKEIGQN